MGLRDMLLTCPELEGEGVWFDVLDTGASFLCRRFRGLDDPGPYTEHYQTAIEPFYVEDEETGEGSYKLHTPEAKLALMDFWAKYIIVGWQNVTKYDVHGDGHSDTEAEPYSPEACVKVLREIPDVFNVVALHSTMRENYLLARRKKQVGN